MFFTRHFAEDTKLNSVTELYKLANVNAKSKYFSQDSLLKIRN
jgi:hypothetical protein